MPLEKIRGFNKIKQSKKQKITYPDKIPWHLFPMPRLSKDGVTCHWCPRQRLQGFALIPNVS